MSFVKRLINVFYAPSETFEAITTRRDWKDLWIPLIILALVGLVASVILKDLTIDYRLDNLERVIENSNRIPAERKAEILNQQYEKTVNPSPFAMVLGYVTAILATPVRVLFFALVVFMAGNFIFGGEAKYIDLLILSGYVYLINILELLVKIPLMLSKWDMEVSTGLGLLGIGEFGDFIYHFLAGVDVFAFWRVILFAIGMSVIYKKPTGPFLMAVTVVWIIILAISAGLGAAFV